MKLEDCEDLVQELINEKDENINSTIRILKEVLNLKEDFAMICVMLENFVKDKDIKRFVSNVSDKREFITILGLIKMCY